MNETLKVIAKRYSCRDYKEERPSDEILQAIANAAIQAPSAMNRQGWQVILVKNKELLSDMESEGMSYLKSLEDQSAYNRIMERGGKLFYGAPSMIIVATQDNDNNYGKIDCGIVCQNISLAATSLGVANVICGLTNLALTSGRAEEFKSRLKFPEGYVFGCSVLLGYANTQKPPHDPNKDKITTID